MDGDMKRPRKHILPLALQCTLLASAIQWPAFGQAPGAPSAAQPPAQPKLATSTSPKGGASIIIINACPDITHLTGWVLGTPAIVRIDGQPAGTVEGCSYRSFKVPAGEREVVVTALDLNLGFPGPRYNVAAGQPTYIRAVHRQYFETKQVAAADAQKAIAQINAIRKK